MGNPKVVARKDQKCANPLCENVFDSFDLSRKYCCRKCCNKVNNKISHELEIEIQKRETVQARDEKNDPKTAHRWTIFDL